MGKKGTAISLPFGSTAEDAITAVRDKYADKRETASGWHGQAVVNVDANDDGKGATTFIVKGLKNGFEVYGLLGRVIDTVEVKTGSFETVAVDADDDAE